MPWRAGVLALALPWLRPSRLPRLASPPRPPRRPLRADTGAHWLDGCAHGLEAPCRANGYVGGATDADAASTGAEECAPASSVRRRLLHASVSALAAGLAVVELAPPMGSMTPAIEVASGTGLRGKLVRQNFAELTSPIFNIPPRRQVYPDWLEGTWLAEQTFAGVAFPVLPKETVLREVDVPGFKTCSIVDFADVGKSPVQYQLRWEKSGDSVVEDVPFNLQSAVSAHLGGKGEVTRILYVPDQDPNRLSLYIRGSRNAERVELFVNARGSESPKSEPDLFFASEYKRQVTFSSRVVQGYNGNYQHFKSFQCLGPDLARLNILTASYVDPLSPLYFQTFDKPVVIFSHDIKLSRAPP